MRQKSEKHILDKEIRKLTRTLITRIKKDGIQIAKYEIELLKTSNNLSRQHKTLDNDMYVIAYELALSTYIDILKQKQTHHDT